MPQAGQGKRLRRRGIRRVGESPGVTAHDSTGYPLGPISISRGSGRSFVRGLTISPGRPLPARIARLMSKAAQHETGGAFHGDFEQLHEEQPQETPGLEQLAQQIRETADKLVRDEASRGDMKLVSTAL